MGLTHEALSEITFGLVVSGRLAPHSVRPELFVPPYDSGLKLYQKGHDNIEFLTANIGLSPIQTALSAADSVNGHNIDYIKMLEMASLKSSVAFKLDRVSKKLKSGEDIDYGEIIGSFNLLDENAFEGKLFSEIVEDTQPLQKCGWKAIDSRLGGIPKSGLITLGGKPSSGKTTLAIKLIKRMLQTYPDKKAIVFSLEMPGDEFKHRAMQTMEFTKQEQERIYVYDIMIGAKELLNYAVRHMDDNICLTVTDFADFLVSDMSETAMAEVYHVHAKLAKLLDIPTLLISQLNRASKEVGIPRPHHLRYTSMAESLSWSIWMLYNPNTDWNFVEGTELPAVDGSAYLVSWKQRGGYLDDYIGPAGLQISWNGKSGWGEEPVGIGWHKITI